MDVRRLPGLRTCAAVYAFAALLCTQIPLLNYLGYEFSFALAFLGSAASGLLAVSWTRTVLSSLERTRRSFLRFAGRVIAVNLLLLALPCAIMLGNAFFVKNCSFAEGVLFYLLLPAISVVFSACLGIFCALHYRHARTMVFAFMLASFLYALALGYYTPAIFSYNFFYGYFPGLTYDEVLRITPALILFRLFTLLLAGFLLWLAQLLYMRCGEKTGLWRKGITLLGAMVEGRNVLVSGVALVGIGAVYAFRCPLGFESTASYIRTQLGGRLETEHFVLYYADSSFTSEEIARIADEHEFQLERILKSFALQRVGTIASYIYPSAGIKQRLIGAGSTNIAKPWRNEVHISQPSLASTLGHELVHVVAGRFGMPVLHASLSTGLTEGLAVATEGASGTRTLHQYAAALRHFHLMPDIASMMTITGFASHASAVSYLVAGSFCRYLIDRYGIRTVTRVYGDLSFEKAFGRPLSELVTEWESFLDRVTVTDSDRGVIDAFFRSPPIFRRVCARVVAGRNAEARLAFRDRSYGRARDLFLMSYEEAGGFESMAGYLRSLFRLGAYGEVVDSARRFMGGLAHPGELLPLFPMIGDACWATGARPDSFYDAAIAANLSDDLVENALLRQQARRTGEEGTFLRYFLADPADSAWGAIVDSMSRNAGSSVLWAYLRTKQLRGDSAAALLARLSLADVSQRLEAMRRVTLGRLLYRLGRFEEARTEFWLSLNNYWTEAANLEAEEWIERCEWKETRSRE